MDLGIEGKLETFQLKTEEEERKRKKRDNERAREDTCVCVYMCVRLEALLCQLRCCVARIKTHSLPKHRSVLGSVLVLLLLSFSFLHYYQQGKNASFLQVYHHTGIAIAMWIGVLSQSPWLVSVVGLNSFIHTLMYTYFFIKTLSPSMHIPAARYLTQAQIGQFFSGITVSFPILIMGESCDTQSSRAGLAFLQMYGYGLVFLFMTFAAKKYRNKKK